MSAGNQPSPNSQPIKAPNSQRGGNKRGDVILEPAKKVILRSDAPAFVPESMASKPEVVAAEHQEEKQKKPVVFEPLIYDQRASLKNLQDPISAIIAKFLVERESARKPVLFFEKGRLSIVFQNQAQTFVALNHPSFWQYQPNQYKKERERLGNTLIDLHGLSSGNAVHVVDQFLRFHGLNIDGNVSPPVKQPLVIVTGAGKHSLNGIPILHHGIGTFLRSLGLAHHAEYGRYVVDVDEVGGHPKMSLEEAKRNSQLRRLTFNKYLSVNRMKSADFEKKLQGDPRVDLDQRINDMLCEIILAYPCIFNIQGAVIEAVVESDHRTTQIEILKTPSIWTIFLRNYEYLYWYVQNRLFDVIPKRSGDFNKKIDETKHKFLGHLFKNFFKKHYQSGKVPKNLVPLTKAPKEFEKAVNSVWSNIINFINKENQSATSKIFSETLGKLPGEESGSLNRSDSPADLPTTQGKEEKYSEVFKKEYYNVPEKDIEFLVKLVNPEERANLIIYRAWMAILQDEMKKSKSLQGRFDQINEEYKLLREHFAITIDEPQDQIEMIKGELGKLIKDKNLASFSPLTDDAVYEDLMVILCPEYLEPSLFYNKEEEAKTASFFETEIEIEGEESDEDEEDDEDDDAGETRSVNFPQNTEKKETVRYEEQDENENNDEDEINEDRDEEQ